MKQTFDLPLSPSTNSLFRAWTPAERARGQHIRSDGILKAGRPRTKGYMTWLNAAGWDLQRQKPRKITGPVSLEILVHEKSKADLSNHVKALEDLLVRHQVIEDDSKEIVRAIYTAWSSDIPNGCRVTVRQI
jgi:Holliday junction resolvase RusA-like endonuclease